jgi:hypothetical protein
MRAALLALKRSSGWIPGDGRIVSWLLLPLVVGELVALIMVGIGDHAYGAANWWRVTAYVVVGLALFVVLWFVFQFGWFVTVDQLFPERQATTATEMGPNAASRSASAESVPSQHLGGPHRSS